MSTGTIHDICGAKVTRPQRADNRSETGGAAHGLLECGVKEERGRYRGIGNDVEARGWELWQGERRQMIPTCRKPTDRVYSKVKCDHVPEHDELRPLCVQGLVRVVGLNGVVASGAVFASQRVHVQPAQCRTVARPAYPFTQCLTDLPESLQMPVHGRSITPNHGKQDGGQRWWLRPCVKPCLRKHGQGFGS